MTPNTSRIAVVYATEQGSTRDIAEFIAEDLGSRGAVVELSDVEHAPDLSRFDVLVLGSAIHDMDLLPAASTYLETHRPLLREMDVRLFGVGLGPALRGPIGRWIGKRVPRRIAATRDAVGARDYQSFAGRYDRVGVSLEARTLYRLLGGPRYGDLRDWAAIRAWSARLADSLGLAKPQSNLVRP
ncbi:flavodoxin domain-containing protein [Nocardia amikacinitolerans]|uniref:flavodoxin domain-containing protein n=1 Tax=Nocardia amikacinitolerans TaxID=756689 RepID=UPI0020A2E985|nr:flavodoxin domain-containing protein [Nocardia amikacinitolerans]MCP2293315.1 menaquinone-dependent protoporphyrinogen oxidase [Nocardia amikacinitolerans]